jgi:hypothetical protein
MAAAHQDRMGDDRVLVDQPGPHGRCGECGAADVHGAAVVGLESLVISVIASPVTRRVFQSTVLVVEENTTFGISCQRRANSISAGVAPGCWSAVGQWELIVSHSLRPYSARPDAATRSDHHWNSSSLGTLQPRSSPGAAM